MNKRTPSEFVEAAICHAQVALTAIAPDSPLAAAPVPDPPTSWPFPASEWQPEWQQPIRQMERAWFLLHHAINQTLSAAREERHG